MIDNHVKYTPKRRFVYHLSRNILLAISLSVISLCIGIFGYHHFEGMSLIDSFVNAAMILSGMGPVGELHQVSGKLFAGFYAIFSGVVFLIIMGIIIAPVMNWALVKFHMNYKDK